MNPRLAAVRVLAQVLDQGRSLAEALPQVQRELPERDRALVQELCYGVLRRRDLLQAVLEQLLSKPLRAREREVQLLLLVGLHQILHMRTPPHAAVSATVEVTRVLGKKWAAGLANAVLRRALRERESLLAAVPAAARLSHPDWLQDALRDAWPKEAEGLMEANNLHPPMSLRVNTQRQSRDEYRRELDEAGIAAAPGPHAEEALLLEKPRGVESLPGFAEGRVSVQDQAAQLAAALLDVPAGARVLDACAAPGGKTCHLLERQPELAELVAVELDPLRMPRIQENLARLELHAKLVEGDAARPADWWDGRPFERILLDAPCSATGVIRRHPDIKWLRRADDIPRLAALQEKLLEALWPLLAEGGRLLYATCSVLPVENSEQIQRFLTRHPEARCEPLPGSWGREQACGRQILSGDEGMDGFYYACLSKRG
ncbi:16S rRNA (cytosine(967)-C(5))-methyltransferase RsmB [Alkalilimnicola sp. S0819]|uniref:16S rRNA (cytosine(967)-C(5))-methyltransferase RsmB n=1 Tax=Alkalilimnicola sp. S0819 TaxID=2613922 RepID=UPI00126143DC|nr:16S rRNA (cytosine(967)-C(5))-methyltransferase RsmB [Alkalilimnicola sp. S0819]KAB7627244.1 16S rRNA (cytosine(967)-C(5))-methyltransferase RsmB [Alkalilimnicola sp. S0819]MPQ15957.1 16S rRNA (cytosine(967)-C(5))-methyltransferase RsmB [Alkalilimnicola sp. S0819]